MPRVAMRLLLALCLVLNGIGNAMAVAAMPAIATAAGASMPLAAVEAAPSTPCDHGADIAASAAAPHPVATAAAGHPADCDGDCCATGECTCPCVHWVPAGLPDAGPPAAEAGRSRVVAALPVGHPAPAPPHAIRPPIG